MNSFINTRKRVFPSPGREQRAPRRGLCPGRWLTSWSGNGRHHRHSILLHISSGIGNMGSYVRIHGSPTRTDASQHNSQRCNCTPEISNNRMATLHLIFPPRIEIRKLHPKENGKHGLEKFRHDTGIVEILEFNTTIFNSYNLCRCIESLNYNV